jgi:hypothetical protein
MKSICEQEPFCLKNTRQSNITRKLRLSISLIALIVCFGFANDARAQSFQFGIDFSSVFPVGEFRDNVDSNGYGVGGNFLVGLGRRPFYVGVDAGFVTYGSETRDQPLIPSIPEVDLEVRTTNNIALTHFLFRAQPRSGAVRPYADALIGFKYLYTRTTINSDIDDEAIASTTNLNDITFSYGFGGGVQVRLASLGGSGDISLDTKVRYLRGSEAEYLKEGSIRRENGNVFFDVLSSRTDVVSFQIGVTFRF